MGRLASSSVSGGSQTVPLRDGRLDAMGDDEEEAHPETIREMRLMNQFMRSRAHGARRSRKDPKAT
jgi:hypothetical protein